MSEPRLLQSSDDLDAAFEASDERPVFVFKHSLVCPISTGAFQRYLQFVGTRGDDADYTLIEIQTSRPLSNAVAERTGVRHESPQALLLRNGTVTWHASHGAIREESLAEALDAIAG